MSRYHTGQHCKCNVFQQIIICFSKTIIYICIRNIDARVERDGFLTNYEERHACEGVALFFF